MKKLFTRIFALAFAVVLALTIAACKPEQNTVRVGIHANEGGATLFAVALEKGYFAEEGLNVQVTVVESGPAEMTAMRADNRSLDIGYIGAGVAWNAIDDSGNRLQFVYLDTLSISEALIANPAKKSVNKESTWTQLYNALQGSKIAIPTDTTPGSWFKNFVAKVNSLAGEGGTELPDSRKLWIYSEDDAYLAGYEAPNTDLANRIFVVNESNENLPLVFNNYDFVCGFAPATISILNTGGVEVANTATHMPEYTFPSTWVASEVWMRENPEVVQKFINALAKASQYRAENIEQSLRWAEKITQANEGTYKADVMIAPSAHELYDWFKDFDGTGYTYMRALYNSKVGNVPAGNRVKTLPEAMNFSYMLKALANVVEVK
ncbi:MAG TPA: ABC transporter substrate-binding protein [Bacilli bacterium]